MDEDYPKAETVTLVFQSMLARPGDHVLGNGAGVWVTAKAKPDDHRPRKNILAQLAAVTRDRPEAVIRPVKEMRLAEDPRLDPLRS